MYISILIYISVQACAKGCVLAKKTPANFFLCFCIIIMKMTINLPNSLINA